MCRYVACRVSLRRPRGNEVKEVVHLAGMVAYTHHKMPYRVCPARVPGRGFRVQTDVETGIAVVPVPSDD